MTAARESWLRSLLAAARVDGPLPTYGDDAWLALPEKSLQRLASAAVYGEHYKRQEENLATHVFDEWWAWREVTDALDAEDAADFASVAAGVRRIANQPTMAQRLAAGYIPRRLP